jgi:hypothetical protein
MLKAILDIYQRTQTAIGANVPLETITALPFFSDIAHMKELKAEQAETAIQSIMDRVRLSFEELGVV